MIDESYKTWLIEVNTNPCLETTCPLLDRVITGLLDNLFKLAVDPIFPPPSFPKTKKHLVPENIFESNKFELIFDELVDGPKLECLPSKGKVKQGGGKEKIGWSSILEYIFFICFFDIYF